MYNPLEIFRYCLIPQVGDMYDTGLEKLLKNLIKKELELDLHGFSFREFIVTNEKTKKDLLKIFREELFTCRI